MPVVLVGTGALARAFAAALGPRLHAILGRSETAARELAGDRECAVWPWDAEAPEGAPLLWLLAVADRAYGDVAAHLAPRMRAGDVALLTSGALELDVLAPLEAVGAHAGRFHPLAPFPRESAGAPPTFAGITAALSGSERALAAGAELARALGARAFELPAGRAADHHRSAAWLSNGLVALFGRVEATSGLASEALRQGWIELLRRTLDALERAPAERALTGPVARGEAAVVADHLEGLFAGPDRALFLAVVRAQLELVREDLSAERLAALEALLSETDA
jgi:predicted short-subunit dehydrogenase-like oxidoreductase (DUF2520 family)